MIFTDRVITIQKTKSIIDEPIIVYRGDYGIKVKFTIMNSKFKFMNPTNLIESENAAYGQLVILTPYGGCIFSEAANCNEGTVTFVLTKEMLDQIEEVGLYSFQIRLFDYKKESRISIPPVEFGIEVREPIASEDHDNSTNNAIVGYSIAKIADALNEKVPDTFDANGNYNKTDWETGDRITEGKLNKIEDAIDTINRNEKSDMTALDNRITDNFKVLQSRKADIGSSISIHQIDKNQGKIDQTYLSDELLQQMAGDTPINATPADGSITLEKLAFQPMNIISENIKYRRFVDISFTKGHLQEDGSIKNAGGYTTSQLIPVQPGDTLEVYPVRMVAHYNENGVFINLIDYGYLESSNYDALLYTIPQNVYGVRFTFHSWNGTGATEGNYINMPDNVKRTPGMLNVFITEIDGDIIRDESVTCDKLDNEITDILSSVSPLEKVDSWYNAFITSNAHPSGEGQYKQHDNYSCSNCFRANKGTIIKIHGCAAPTAAILSEWTKDGQFIKNIFTGSYNSNDVSNIKDYEYTVSSDGYFRICYCMIYEPFDYSITDSNSVYSKINSLDKRVTHIIGDAKPCEEPTAWSSFFVASSNHTQTGTLVSYSDYRCSNCFYLTRGTIIKIHGCTTPNAAILSEWTADGTYIRDVFVGDYNSTTNVITTIDYEYTVPSDGYFRICYGINYAPFEYEIMPAPAYEHSVLSFDDVDFSLYRDMPLITFVFDDGNIPSMGNIVKLFDEYDMKCGFGIITNRVVDFSILCDYQNRGYEMLSHSLSHQNIFNIDNNEELVLAEILNSKKVMEANGLRIRGWVTPNSVLKAEYLSLLQRYYKYGYTKFFGRDTNTDQMSRYVDKYELGRYSLEYVDIDALKSIIDEAIADNKNIHFYGHTYPSDTMTESKMTSLLDYVKSKQDINACKVVLPYQATLGQYSNFEKNILNKLQ